MQTKQSLIYQSFEIKKPKNYKDLQGIQVRNS